VFHIELEQDAEISVFDQFGKVVLHYLNTNGHVGRSLSMFKEGLYYVHVKYADKIHTQKIVKVATP